MNSDRFQVLIEGALAIWRVDAALSFAETGNSCEISLEGREASTISMETPPFGIVWRIREPGRRDRVHASIGPALRGLREIIRPDRAAGRVLFVSEAGP
jgi:hypothetical protein